MGLPVRYMTTKYVVVLTLVGSAIAIRKAKRKMVVVSSGVAPGTWMRVEIIVALARSPGSPRGHLGSWRSQK